MPNYHYTSTHQILPAILRSGTKMLFSMRANKDRARAIMNLFDDVCGALEVIVSDQEKAEISVDHINLAKYPTILITMPQPTMPTHAHLIAIVLTTENESRYFLLEEAAEGPDPFLCELADGKHLNYGQVSSREFLAKIANIL